jgi:type II secretory ATPase GspE/PulE/Tfp pilus assembly ATPase PilB-like protein
MIGEIRDVASAQLAIQAAQTGHLVLSTLHTRNASGVLDRLKNLGIDSEAIESCLRFVSSQRLVRQRCMHCISHAKTDQCPQCNSSGYFGRIGVHEVLAGNQIFSSAPYLDLYSAGVLAVKAGLIDQATLDAEVGTWH